jgi:hypothetical protein
LRRILSLVRHHQMNRQENLQQKSLSSNSVVQIIVKAVVMVKCNQGPSA